MKRPCNLYVLELTEPPLCKVGISTNVPNRLAAIRRSIPCGNVRLVAKFDISNAKEIEQSVLRYFRHAVVKGEWLDAPKDTILNFICSTIINKYEVNL